MKQAKGEKISLSSQLGSRVEVLQVAWMTRASHRSLTVLISSVMQRNLPKLPSETGDGPSPITEVQVKCISISFKEKVTHFCRLDSQRWEMGACFEVRGNITDVQEDVHETL